MCALFPQIDRTTVMLHLRVLEEAGLVVPVKKGRERFNYLDAMPIQAIHERWIGPHAASAAQGLSVLQAQLDAEIGRAACRESVCQYVYISVSAVSVKQKERKEQ